MGTGSTRPARFVYISYVSIVVCFSLANVPCISVFHAFAIVCFVALKMWLTSTCSLFAIPGIGKSLGSGS